MTQDQAKSASKSNRFAMVIESPIGISEPEVSDSEETKSDLYPILDEGSSCSTSSQHNNDKDYVSIYPLPEFPAIREGILNDIESKYSDRSLPQDNDSYGSIRTLMPPDVELLSPKETHSDYEFPQDVLQEPSAPPLSECGSDSEEENELPNEYICPIKLEIMNKPVLLIETGHTYEEEAIKEWLKDNNTDPLNGCELVVKTYVVNYALKTLIEDWKSKQHPGLSHHRPML